MKKANKIIILLTLVIILLIPALHKLNADLPPQWFLDKFESTILNSIPVGLNISFYIILALEVIAPLFMFFGIIKLAFNKQSNESNQYSKPISIAFTLYYVLFAILTFGSFLVQDYSNGFKDFTYLVGIVIIQSFCFKES